MCFVILKSKFIAKQVQWWILVCPRMRVQKSRDEEAFVTEPFLVIWYIAKTSPDIPIHVPCWQVLWCDVNVVKWHVAKRMDICWASKRPCVEMAWVHVSFSGLSTRHYSVYPRVISWFDHVSSSCLSTCKTSCVCCWTTCRLHILKRIIFFVDHMSSPNFATYLFCVLPRLLTRFVHVSISYLSTCPFQVCLRFFSCLSTSQFLACPCVIFMLTHLLYLGTATGPFPNCACVLYRIAHMAFPYLPACQFMISTCVRSRTAGLLIDVEYSRIKDDSWHVPYPVVTTRAEVGLVE